MIRPSWGVIGLALLFGLLAGPALAWTPSPAQVVQLRRGVVIAEVFGSPQQETGVIHGAVDIAAPRSVVWAVMNDCARAHRMAPSVRACRILEADPGGRWDVREMTLRYGFLFGRVRSRFRSDFEPERRIAFTCVPGGDFRACHGEWRLEPIEGGVRVIYENTVSADIPVPAALVRASLRMEVPDALRALRREALGAAR